MNSGPPMNATQGSSVNDRRQEGAQKSQQRHFLPLINADERG
jgi:hypothetical protein